MDKKTLGLTYADAVNDNFPMRSNAAEADTEFWESEETAMEIAIRRSLDEKVFSTLTHFIYLFFFINFITI